MLHFDLLSSIVDRASDNRAKELPMLTIEAPRLHLLDQVEIGRARVDPDPGTSIGNSRSSRFAACFIRFSRVSVPSHCFSTWTSVWAIEPTFARFRRFRGQGSRF